MSESNQKEIRRSFLNLARDELALKPYVVQLLEDHEIDWDIARDLTHADLLHMGVKEIGTQLRILKWIRGKFSNGISMPAPAQGSAISTSLPSSITPSSSSSSSSAAAAVLTSTVIVAHTSDVSPQAALIQMAQSSPDKTLRHPPLNPTANPGYFKPFHPPATRTVLASREQPSSSRSNHHHHHHHQHQSQGQNGHHRRHSSSPAPKTDSADASDFLELGVRKRKSERVMDEAKELLGDEPYQRLVMTQPTKRERIHTSSCIMACFGDPSSLKFNKSIKSLEGYRDFLEKQDFESYSTLYKDLDTFAAHKRGRFTQINAYLSQIFARREERNEENFEDEDLDDEDNQQKQPKPPKTEGEVAAEPKKRGRKRKNPAPASTDSNPGETGKEGEEPKKDPTKDQENGEETSSEDDDEGKEEGRETRKEATGDAEPGPENPAAEPPKKKSRLSFDKKLAAEARAAQEAPVLLSQEEVKTELGPALPAMAVGE